MRADDRDSGWSAASDGGAKMPYDGEPETETEVAAVEGADGGVDVADGGFGGEGDEGGGGFADGGRGLRGAGRWGGGDDADAVNF